MTNWQLNIPQGIRDALQWQIHDMHVKIEPTKRGFRVEPSMRTPQKKRQLTKKKWDEILEDMKRISTFGKRGVNLTEFIRKDRDTHL